MNATFVIWFKGLLAAAIHGGAASIAITVVDPARFTFSGWEHIGGAFLAFAAIGVGSYLAQSPLPGATTPNS